MRCIDAQELMAACVTGEVSDAVRTEVMRHTSTCPSCHDWYEETVASFSLWNKPGHAQPPSGFDEKVMERITKQEKTYVQNIGPRLRRAAVIHYGIAASLTLALLGTGSFQYVGVGMTVVRTMLFAAVANFGHVVTHWGL
jgi:anti-sigma factor RsiW